MHGIDPKLLDSQDDEEEAKKPLDLNVIRATLASNGYSFLRPIGQGGFSSVFLVYSNQYDLEFVVKVSDYKGSHKDGLSDSNEFDLTEINNLINLNHPNIINMYKYFTDDHYLYIVLEYCQGGSLKGVISKNGRIRSANLYHYCHQILTALKHCHDLQIAHNDIKPANVLIDKNQRLKLADFGLSKSFSSKLYHTDNSTTNDDDHIVDKNGEIKIKHFVGSKPYMAPELLNLTAYDPFKADIWALGVTFYELSTGHLPWKTTDLKQMRLQITVGVFSFQNVKLPSTFCKLIHRMLEVIPTRRPTVDWLLEQPIFNQEHQNNQSNRTSMLNRSMTFNSNLNMARYRSSDRIKNYGSLTFVQKNSLTISSSNSENELKASDSSSIGLSDEQPKSPVDSNSPCVSFSPLQPLDDGDEIPIDSDDEVRDVNEGGPKLGAAPRQKKRRSDKKMRSSLPLQKTFL